jgi:glucose-1-phosphate thymidylyltransferase
MSELIGLLPAAGRGSRLGAIPCSKEIMPLGFQRHPAPDGVQWRPVTAIETHLHALRLAGATRAAIVISESKADIVRYVGDGERYGLSISYLYQQRLSGMPFALDLAAPWIGSATTVFAMPDTILEPADTIARLVRRHLEQPADVTLGLFHTGTPYKFGMVDLTDQGDVRGFIDKPARTTLHLMWGLAVWSPRFTRHLSQFLLSAESSMREIVLSDVFEAALGGGLTFQGLALDGAHYHDIGTPEDFQTVVHALASRQATAIDESKSLK